MLNDQAKQERDSPLLPVLLKATEGKASHLATKSECHYFISPSTDRERDVCLSNSCGQLSQHPRNYRRTWGEKARRVSEKLWLCLHLCVVWPMGVLIKGTSSLRWRWLKMSHPTVRWAWNAVQRWRIEQRLVTMRAVSHLSQWHVGVCRWFLERVIR